MLNTSLDVLYLTLALCVFLLTLFLCWALYYLIRLGRNAVYTVEKFTSVLHKADEVLDMLKEKLHSSGAYIGLLANAVKSVVEYMKDRPERKERKRVRG